MVVSNGKHFVRLNIKFFHIYILKFIFRGGIGGAAERKEERGSHAGSTPSTEPNKGLHLTTLRS